MDNTFNTQNALASFQCMACAKDFSNPTGLMKHIVQTPCIKRYLPMLKQSNNDALVQATQLATNIQQDSETDQFPMMEDAMDASAVDSLGSDAAGDEMSFASDNGPWDCVPPRKPSTIHQQIEVALLCILRDIGAPLGTFQRIMRWAANACSKGYTFIPDREHYDTQLKHLESVHKLSNLRPFHTTTFLEGHQQPVQTISFDFKAHLKSLLEDPVLNQIQNLVVNPQDPFLPFSTENQCRSEILTGSWYQTACSTMITNPSKQFCCPIVIATDKTTISEKADYSSHPVFFTLAIFNKMVSKLQQTL